MKYNVRLTANNDVNGYPFFPVSRFVAWIAYKNGRKQKYHSIETKTTVMQLLTKKVLVLELNRQDGYNKLVSLISRKQHDIRCAQIYWNGTKTKLYFEFKNDEITVSNPPDFILNPAIEKIPFVLDGNTLILNPIPNM